MEQEGEALKDGFDEFILLLSLIISLVCVCQVRPRLQQELEDLRGSLESHALGILVHL